MFKIYVNYKILIKLSVMHYVFICCVYRDSVLKHVAKTCSMPAVYFTINLHIFMYICWLYLSICIWTPFGLGLSCYPELIFQPPRIKNTNRLWKVLALQQVNLKLTDSNIASGTCYSERIFVRSYVPQENAGRVTEMTTKHFLYIAYIMYYSLINMSRSCLAWPSDSFDK